MAQSDWEVLSDGLDSVQQGVTAGAAPPNGGGSYCYGIHSKANAKGVAGVVCTVPTFSAMSYGGRITGALKRSSLGSPSGFAPFLFIGAKGNGVAANAYLLGLSDANASHIELRKGVIADGLPDADVTPRTAPNILMRSKDTIAVDTWVHLRLDYIVQGNGDVLLQVFRNDLTQHQVTSPLWQLVPGMEGAFHPTFDGYIDDNLAVNTGSNPLKGGTRVGYAARFETAGRAAYFDHITVDRQL